MKTDLKAKYLRFLSEKRKDEGFTLIELLVVIIIIGILSAIALPSFLNQAAKAKQSEAKTAVGSYVRTQQAYRMENPNFAPDFDTLRLGLSDPGEHYDYTTSASDVTTNTILATPADTAALKGYSGGVVIKTIGTTEAITCQTDDVQGQTNVVIPVLNTSTNTASSCAANHSTMQ